MATELRWFYICFPLLRWRQLRKEARRHPAPISSDIVLRLHSHPGNFTLSCIISHCVHTLTSAHRCTRTRVALRLIDRCIFSCTVVPQRLNAKQMGPASRLLRHHWAVVLYVTLCHIHLDRSLTMQTIRWRILELMVFRGDNSRRYTTLANYLNSFLFFLPCFFCKIAPRWT